MKPPMNEGITRGYDNIVSEAWAAYFDAVALGTDMAGGPSGALIAFPVDMAGVTEALARADGAAISRRDNPGLFRAYGEMFGSGDGSTTFNLPTIADAGGVRWYVRLG